MRFFRSVMAATMVVLVVPSLACKPECDAGYGFGCAAAMTKNECGECVITAEKYKDLTCSYGGAGYGGGYGDDEDEARPVLPPLGDSDANAIPDAGAEADAGAYADAGAEADADADADADAPPPAAPEALEEPLPVQ